MTRNGRLLPVEHNVENVRKIWRLHQPLTDDWVTLRMNEHKQCSKTSTIEHYSKFLEHWYTQKNGHTKGNRSTQEQLRAPHTWSWGERSTTLDSWEVACVSNPQFKHLFTVHSPTASLCTKYECSYNRKFKCIEPLLLLTVKSRFLFF